MHTQFKMYMHNVLDHICFGGRSTGVQAGPIPGWSR
jgi:hypothetical protein